MKHKYRNRCSRFCQKLSLKHLGFITCYTVIIIVVASITDKYNIERLTEKVVLKGYEYDINNSMQMMTNGQDIQHHEYDQQDKQANGHDIQLKGFNQQDKLTNGHDIQLKGFNQQDKLTNGHGIQLKGFNQQDTQTNGQDIQLKGFNQQDKQTNGFDIGLESSGEQAEHAPTNVLHHGVRAVTSKVTSNPVVSRFQQTVKSYRKLATIATGETSNPVQEWFTIKDESKQDPILNKHQYILHQTSNVCDRHIDLLILVHSTVNNSDRRRAIRLHYGSVHYFKNISIGTVFFLGESVDTQMNMNVAAEASTNMDIVQGNFIDSYTNLTYKHVMALHWMTSQCRDVRTVVKVDDDLVIDIFKLVSFSRSVGHYENTLYCSIFRRIPAIRDPTDKWYTPYDMYPFDVYPDYCEGFAYIMSMAEAHLMYKASEVMRFYWVDDVYVTGVLTLKAGIKLRSFKQQHGYTKENRFSGLEEKDVMFYLNYNDWRKMWFTILSRRYRY